MIKVSKRNGLKVMAHYFNIQLEDTVAIGDGNNDIQMYKVAALAIAIENAKGEAKEYCHVVTLTNDENGFTYAIKKYTLKG